MTMRKYVKKYQRSLPDMPAMSDLPDFPKTEVARGLGWASIAIGLAEIAAPRAIERMVGVGNSENTGILRVCGAREILQGIDILSHRDPAPGVWARVAGDALDIALLGVAATRTRKPGGLMTALAMVLGIAAVDVLTAQQFSSD